MIKTEASFMRDEPGAVRLDSLLAMQTRAAPMPFHNIAANCHLTLLVTFESKTCWRESYVLWVA